MQSIEQERMACACGKKCHERELSATISAIAVLPDPTDRRSIDADDGWEADMTGDNGWSPISAAPSSAASLPRKASSTCRASAAVKLFLVPRIRCPQMAASSDEAIALSSPAS